MSPTAARIDVLIDACRFALGTSEDLAAIQLGAVSSHELLVAARDSCLTVPLYKAAKHSPTASTDFLLSIDEMFTAIATRNLQLTSALLQVLETLSADDIEVLVVKGAALSLIAFGQITAREFTDLDILVPPGKIEQAERVLSRLGYERVGDYEPDSRTEKHLQLLRKSDELLVELHWALNPPSLRFPLESITLWHESQVLTVGDTSFTTLSVEDTLLALCIHAVRHGWSDLKCAYDLAGLLQRNGNTIDWSKLLKRCNQLGCTRALLAGIQVSRNLFGITLPLRPLQHVENERVAEDIAKSICLRLRAGHSVEARDIVGLQIRVHDRFVDRVFALATLSVPELPRLLPKFARPITRGAFRYLARPVRLVGLYGFSWLRSVLFSRR